MNIRRRFFLTHLLPLARSFFENPITLAVELPSLPGNPECPAADSRCDGSAAFLPEFIKSLL
jgi:hypothetical protein